VSRRPGPGFEQIGITAGRVSQKKERNHEKPVDGYGTVDDFVTQNTPGLQIWQEVWGDMQCAYHIFAPGTDFTELLKPMPDGLCGVPHHAYIISGTLKVIYKDGTTDVCNAGDVCYWPAPHNFISEEGAEIIQFSGAGALAAQAEVIAELTAKQVQA
jgi:hypothetical protein